MSKIRTGVYVVSYTEAGRYVTFHGKCFQFFLRKSLAGTKPGDFSFTLDKFKVFYLIQSKGEVTRRRSRIIGRCYKHFFQSIAWIIQLRYEVHKPNYCFL